MKKLLLIGMITCSLIACGQEKCDSTYREELDIILQEAKISTSIYAMSERSGNLKGSLASIVAINKDIADRIDHMLVSHKNEIPSDEQSYLMRLKEQIMENNVSTKKAGV